MRSELPESYQDGQFDQLAGVGVNQVTGATEAQSLALSALGAFAENLPCRIRLASSW